eukprot:761851-Hanusia_phi.AAC.4
MLQASSVFLGIEIKPKCGFLPDRRLLSAATAIKAEKSRYQMMQHEKLRIGKISSISKYDPLDLFSEDVQQMQKAVETIYNMIQDPQNVFRVWVCDDRSSQAIRHVESEGELLQAVGRFITSHRLTGVSFAHSVCRSRAMESTESFCRFGSSWAVCCIPLFLSAL